MNRDVKMPDLFKCWPVKRLACEKKQLLLFFGLLFILLFLVLQNFGFLGRPNGISKLDEKILPIPPINPEDGFRGAGDGNISFAFFYDPGCKCTEEAIPELKELEIEYPEVNQVWYNLTYPENKTKWVDFMDPSAYNVPNRIKDDTPFLFIGDYYFHHEEITFENVSDIIELYKGKNVPLWPAWELTWSVHIAFFHDPEVDDARIGLESVRLLNNTWNRNITHLIIHNYSLVNPTNKLLLDAYFVEYNLSKVTQYEKANELYVAFFIDNDFILNMDITYGLLNNTVTKYSGSNIALPDIKPDISGGIICVIFFYSPTCGDCHTARNILEDLKAKYPELNVKEYNIADSDNLILQLSYYDYYGVPGEEQGTLAVFIGDKYLVKDDLKDGNFRSALEDQIKQKLDGCPCPDVEPDEDIVKYKFLGFTVLAVLLGGLVDSINPCAIATLIFFIGYLAATGRTKKQVLLIGLAYTIGIFITYMALGLGIYSLIATSEKEIELFAEIFFPIIIIVTIIFGFYSLYDFNKARKGKKEEMKLQLPKSVKSLIGRVIKHQVPLRYFVIIAILTGVIISTLEFLCTGQVYLPTISLVARSVPELQGQAIFLLFLYNLMFVLPLVIIFVAVYFGMRSEQLQGFLDKNRAMFKLLTAIVFFILGGFLIWYSWEFVF